MFLTGRSFHLQACVHLFGDEEISKALEMDGCLYGSKFGRYRVRVTRKTEFDEPERKTPDLTPRVDDREKSQKDESTRSSSIQTSSGECRGKTEYENIIVLDGMPPAMSKEDVQYLLWGTNVSQRDIRIIYKEEEPYILVIYRNNDIASNVVTRWNGTVITTKNGSHTVRVRTAADLLRSDESEFVVKGTVLKMTEIPLKITPQDIAEFFHGFPVKAKGIHLQNNLRLLSVAYIEFEGLEATRMALQKDGSSLCGKFKDKPCRLSVIPQIEMELEMLKNQQCRECPSRWRSRFVDQSRNMGQILNPYQLMPCRTVADTRVLAHKPMTRPQIMPIRTLDSESSLHLLSCKGKETSKTAKYYVKDLETGKSLYLDQCFVPAGMPSHENPGRDGLEEHKASRLKPGSLRSHADVNNASSESDMTHMSTIEHVDRQKSNRLQHKRQSGEIEVSRSKGQEEARPYKHR